MPPLMKDCGLIISCVREKFDLNAELQLVLHTPWSVEVLKVLLFHHKMTFDPRMLTEHCSDLLVNFLPDIFPQYKWLHSVDDAQKSLTGEGSQGHGCEGGEVAGLS